MSATRNRLRIATIAEVTFAALLVIALVAGAPTWEVVVLAVLFADAAAYGVWQMVKLRRGEGAPRAVVTGA